MHAKNGSLVYSIGVMFLILSFLSPLFSLLIPFFHLKTETAVFLGTLFLVGLPEVFFVLGMLLAGKKIATQMTRKVKAWLGFKKNEEN